MKKNIIITAAVIVIIAAAIWAAATYFQRPSQEPAEALSDQPKVEIRFMADEEKAALGLQPETKVQVIGRDENGEIMSYKIIRNDADIVTDASIPYVPEKQ